MKSELKKLKGFSIKTSIGQFTLKENVRLEDSEFDQIYFKANEQDSICKIYDLTQSISTYRYQCEIEHYRSFTIPNIHPKIHDEEFKIKKKSYGLIVFIGLGKQNALNNYIDKINDEQLYKLAYNLLVLLSYLQQNNRIFLNIRPYSIYKSNNDFVLIDVELLEDKKAIRQVKPFVLEIVQKDWRYWAPQILDPYSTTPIDFNIDTFAIGCILYEFKIGKYPFQTKLAEMNLNYERFNNHEKDIITEIITQCLSPLEMRKNFNIVKYLQQLKQCISLENSPTQVTKKDFDPKLTKRQANTGILDNISSVFSKMMNDTQGFYLNYVEDTDKQPQDKYLESMLVKLYKGHQKLDKLSTVMSKHTHLNSDKVNPLIKTLLLIGYLLRKGPTNTFTILKANIKQILEENGGGMNEQVELLSALLKSKLNLHQKIRKCMVGNFYIHDVSLFKRLEIKDFDYMIGYLQKLVKCLKKYTTQIKNSELYSAIVNFICDEIYDLVSMLVMSIIALRKDNDLQLRTDNLQQLAPIQRKFNLSLKKISALSNHTGAHAIYSIENDYIVYQQQINLSKNPYYSSLEHFFRSSRGYKGLSIPENFEAFYTGTQHIQKKLTVQSGSPAKKGSNKKKYFSDNLEIDSDEQPQKNIQVANNFNFEDFSSILESQQAYFKLSKKKSKNSEDCRNSNNSKGSQKPTTKPITKHSNKPHKAEVSFADFLNITTQTNKNLTPTIPPRSAIKNQSNNQFNIFNEFQDCNISKPPMNKKNKIQSTKPSKNNPIVNSKSSSKHCFDQFNKITIKSTSNNGNNCLSQQKRVQKKQNKKKGLAIELGFQDLKQMNNPPHVQNNPFTFAKEYSHSSGNLHENQNHIVNGNKQHLDLPKNSNQLQLPTPKNFSNIIVNNNFSEFQLHTQPQNKTLQQVEVIKMNPLLKSILNGLKLKELKDLLHKNEKYVIDYKLLTFIKVIGSGSAGQVSFGTYKNIPVAIKKVKIKQNPNALKQFERQLVTYIKIKNSPYLVSLIGLSENNGDFFLMTQFCDYGSLFDILHKRSDLQYSWAERLRFCMEIAEGMQFLHSMKPVIIHRDLKSLNIFVAKENGTYKMKVADFGLSRSPEAQMMTTQLGTIHWMAPQLLQGKQYSLKVDIYSYGVLMWEILSRKTPYNHLQNPMAILKYVVIDKMRPDMQQIPPDCPKKLIQIVQKCWGPDPAQRPSFSKIIQELKLVRL